MSRSFLFVPADSERKIKKALESVADAVILDLEDSVAISERPRARTLARAALDEGSEKPMWVRINPMSTADALEDLRSIVPSAPYGIVLPKATGARDALQLSKLLGVMEQENGIPEGQTSIMPIATETPAAIFRLGEFDSSLTRMAGLTWGAEDLSSAIGATANRDAEGNWLPPYELARSLCLFAAAAAEVAAIDTVYSDFGDGTGLKNYAENARRDGFSGMLAIHPDQLESINAAFTPTADEVSRAARIIDLFEQDASSGVIGMDGEMLDRPHFLQAQKIIAMAALSPEQKIDND